MKENYQRIIGNEMLEGNVGVIKRGVLNVSADVFFLLKDVEMRDYVFAGLEIEDELKEGEKVEVFRGEEYLGDARIVQYPMEEANGFATVKFCDEAVMANLYVVNVGYLRVAEE